MRHPFSDPKKCPGGENLGRNVSQSCCSSGVAYKIGGLQSSLVMEPSSALYMINDTWVKIDKHEKIVGNMCQDFNVLLIIKTLIVKSFLLYFLMEKLWGM